MPSRIIALVSSACLLGVLACAAADDSAEPLTEPQPLLETITCQLDGEARSLEGAVLVEAQDGGLLVMDVFGELFRVPGDAAPQRTPSERPYAVAGPEELGERLQSVFEGDTRLVVTEHYVIATSGSVEFAEWAGAVLDLFHFSALDSWTEMGLAPVAPEGRLPVLILANRDEYAEFATLDTSADVAQTRAYYSMRTNRMVLHDPLSEAVESPADLTQREVDRRMAELPQSIGTLLHEATHQLAYNCGLHRRYADNPMWLTEGLAMCVEPCDATRYSVDVRLNRPNADRLAGFKSFVRERRPEGSLSGILSSEDLFRAADTHTDAYSESWALSWFLIREHREEYVGYLRMISRKPLMIWDDPATRLAEFESAFGDVQELEREFLRWMARR